MAESLLLPVVSRVAGKAADALVQRVTRMCGVDDDRRRLERQLLAVQCTLTDAEAKSETKPAVKRWMKDLRAVAYEAGDVLDDFRYEALRGEAQIGGDSAARKVLGYFTPHNPLLFRAVMSRKLDDVLKKITDLVMEMSTFGLVERAEAAPAIHPQTHSGMDSLMEIVGRDDDKEILVDLLLEQRSKNRIEVMPIVGMGGLGKTTLAKMVYSDFRVHQHFELLMWLCVSDDFSVTAIVKSIIESATRDNCTLPDRIELLRGRLHEVVGRKRYLLVLDDVWNEEEQKWEDLRPLLHSAGGPGSAIVVTTRSQRVASIMGTLPAHMLSYLDQDDSWELFRKRAFSKEEEEQPELAEVGKRIVSKCKGLPLALKTMGSLMSSKKQIQEWEAIAASKSWDDVGTTNQILSILKLSYRHLTLEMKLCFVFCAIFPKDYQMERDRLIQLWIANDFIQDQGIMDLEERGRFVFHELMWRSFFQDVKAETFYAGTQQYKSITCSMHDLMHDLAKSVTEECIHIQDLNQQKASMKEVRHLMSSSNLQENIELIEHVERPLHTLLSPYWLPSSSLPRNIKKLNFTSLRALHNASLHISPKVLANIRHLRYLDLSNFRELVILSESICMLYSLQTLRLTQCENLEHLPEGMRFMSKLRHLYLDGCRSLKRMPPRIGMLKNLWTLTKFVVDREDGRGLEELKDLQHLCGRLELFNLNAVQSGLNGRESNLHLNQNVNELLLYWCRDRSECRGHDVVANKKDILEFTLPTSKLESLRVYGSGHIEMSSWMKNPKIFLCLKELSMSDCWRCTDLPPLWQSGSLESLSLSRLDNLTTLSSGVDMVVQGCNGSLEFFPKLKRMSLNYLPNLDRWIDNEVAITTVMFPELKELTIGNCPKLVNIPKAPILRELDINQCKIEVNSLSHLTALSQLKYHGDWCVSTDAQVIPLSCWPSLVTLHLGLLGNLVLPEEKQTMPPLESIRQLWLSYSNCFFSRNSSNWLFGFGDCFAFLEELVIVSCDDLVHWPVKELRGLNSLRHVEFSYCKNLIGSPSSSEESLFPLGLETLHLNFCKNLSEIPKLPASLEILGINECTSLVSLPTNLGDLAKLRYLKLFSCVSLRKLPETMDGLIALQELYVQQCPGVETLPLSLLQRLPHLRKLMTLGSHKLDRRCRRGGEYWEFVSKIPCLNRDFIEAKSNDKGFAKRLVPCCSTLN
ncbi:putative disease resistance protein RGA1 [Oryza brachyantha]|uniref:Uncharacterized protein n=1 Tax=Oryza brachyantha TaxID=4533 RepID=J3MUX0_ORYBR|nr:putative disease resistance protein RGA1 [Oryza brachyantha]XP_040382598.1 putative disease resistance protein RGA1 [Oryza brachyantha]